MNQRNIAIWFGNPYPWQNISWCIVSKKLVASEGLFWHDKNWARSDVIFSHISHKKCSRDTKNNTN